MSTPLTAPASRVAWRSVDDVPPAWPGAAITAGVFDGFHRGHRALVERCRTRAGELGVPSVLLTFDPHPLTVTRPDHAPPMLLSVDERIATAHHLGIDAVLVLEFTRELADVSPDRFIEHVAVDALRAKAVVVGENFRYGSRGSGGPDHLRAAGVRHGFTVDVVPLVERDGVVCSSTEIRRCLANGDHVRARRLLGQPQTV